MKNKIKQNLEINLDTKDCTFRPHLTPKTYEYAPSVERVDKRLYSNYGHSRVCGRVCTQTDESDR